VKMSDERVRQLDWKLRKLFSYEGFELIHWILIYIELYHVFVSVLISVVSTVIYSHC